MGTIIQLVQEMVEKGLINASDKEHFIRKYAETQEIHSDTRGVNNAVTTNASFPKDYPNAAAAELEQLLGCKVPIGRYADSNVKWLEEFSKEAQRVQSGSVSVSIDQKRAIEQLLNLGFSGEAAKAMICSKYLSLPLSETICKNAMLLRSYVDIGSFSADEPSPYTVASFLRNAHEKNLFMEGIPQRYPFTEEQKQSYFSNPLQWTIDYDLRDQLGEVFFDLFGDAERVDCLLCRMYCTGNYLQPSEKIKEDIAALLSLNPDSDELRKFVETAWELLFTFYKDTARAISILADIFQSEFVWTIFYKECVWLTGVVRDSRGEYLDQLPSSLVGLRERYSQYIK